MEHLDSGTMWYLDPFITHWCVPLDRVGAVIDIFLRGEASGWEEYEG